MYLFVFINILRHRPIRFASRTFLVHRHSVTLLDQQNLSLAHALSQFGETRRILAQYSRQST